MVSYTKLYIDGAWVDPLSPARLEVVNPATERSFAEISLGSGADVELAVAAAKRAFPSYAATSRQERLDLLETILAVYRKRSRELAEAVSSEMGAPLPFALERQVGAGLGHLQNSIDVLRAYEFDERLGDSLITREPIGVCGFITPWNWPLNQITCKVGPALATGCTMILKPSELSPLCGMIFADILHEAGVPNGVFNLVNGDGPGVGQALSSHPDIDLISFTGSTAAGIQVAKAAADTVKRVQQELGGKSPNILLDDADFGTAVAHGVRACFANSGQSCNAPTRMLVPSARQEEAVQIAAEIAAETIVGDPRVAGTVIGPVISTRQFGKVQALIKAGIGEGARLVAGGPGLPEGLTEGYYVRPTVFADVRNDMAIAREEVFGPVLAILPYADEAEAIAIANDTPYGLSSYVSSSDIDRARAVARQIRAGMVHLNGARIPPGAPFGGYKQSGNGRERGRHGFDEFLELKAIFGYAPD
jgi:aldehyde dehydrogenase (NAD+)